MPFNNYKIREKRIGEIGYNNFGSKMMIIDYNTNIDMIVEFQDEYKIRKHTSYQKFMKGNVHNPYDRTMRGVGYIGVGKFQPHDNAKMYTSWANMFERSYNKKFKNIHNTYNDCIVDKRFHCFQDFGVWFNDNYYEIENETMCLDKDILYKGNKIYGPETCIFVPDFINKIFPRSDATRGGLPIGVSYVSCETTNCFAASCSIYDENLGYRKKKHLGTFDNEYDAFLAYKTYKEAYIKIIANKYKNKIPNKLYNALYNYKIEITD